MKIKKELQAEYAKYVAINGEDDYSKACVDAGEAVGNALDEGKTAQEALKMLHGLGLTGFMASMAAKSVAHFSPRGEEIRVAWNEQNGIKHDKGIVNTAILTSEDNGTVSPEIESV